MKERKKEGRKGTKVKEEKRKIEGNEEKQRNNCIEPGIHIAMLQLHAHCYVCTSFNRKDRQTDRKGKKRRKQEKKRKKRKK